VEKRLEVKSQGEKVRGVRGVRIALFQPPFNDDEIMIGIVMIVVIESD